jgi:REP element-mobilizing transposase RayT
LTNVPFRRLLGDAMKDYSVRSHYLPRLPREYYQADAMVHWTLTVFDRAQGWLNEIFHLRFRELMLHTAAREGLLCPAYCLMPDHLHLVWLGLRPDTDQFTGMAFLRTHLEPALASARFQPQAHDHVRRHEERGHDALMASVAYDLQNPVLRGLVARPEDWAYTGCVVPGYPKLHPLEDGFWPKFWKLYQAQRDPACDRHVLPPLSGN